GKLYHRSGATCVPALQRNQRPPEVLAVAPARMLEQAPTPPAELHDRRLERRARLRERIELPRSGRRGLPLFHEARFRHFLEPFGEQIRGDPLERVEQIPVAPRPENELPHDEERPSLPHHVQGAGEAAVLLVRAPDGSLLFHTLLSDSMY